MCSLALTAWLSWLSIIPTETKVAGLTTPAHAWVVGLVPGWGVFKRQPID